MEASLAKVVQHFKLIGNTDALREGKRLRAQFQAGSIAGAVLQMDAKTRFRAAAEVVADIHMLAGSDFLLGVCWSGVSAIAVSGGRSAPYRMSIGRDMLIWIHDIEHCVPWHRCAPSLLSYG